MEIHRIELEMKLYKIKYPNFDSNLLVTDATFNRIELIKNDELLRAENFFSSEYLKISLDDMHSDYLLNYLQKINKGPICSEKEYIETH